MPRVEERDELGNAAHETLGDLVRNRVGGVVIGIQQMKHDVVEGLKHGHGSLAQGPLLLGAHREDGHRKVTNHVGHEQLTGANVRHIHPLGSAMTINAHPNNEAEAVPRLTNRLRLVELGHEHVVLRDVRQTQRLKLLGGDQKLVLVQLGNPSVVVVVVHQAQVLEEEVLISLYTEPSCKLSRYVTKKKNIRTVNNN